ncbi:hypothetical protein BKA69DRAFT_289838 [Paraphysoderma sedebokerense]|nr:hypothetical protein BKA69DRAFT_289838 [Paraphysoderma sedebokerense]
MSDAVHQKLWGRQCLLVLCILLAASCNLVFAISTPWYITHTATTGLPYSANWFPNNTGIIDTVAAPNGSIYVLDSLNVLYKLDNFSNAIQKVALSSPGAPYTTWHLPYAKQIIRLWIHPQSYDPYIFRLRWSTVPANTENVMIDIMRYPGIDYNIPSTLRPEVITLNTQIPAASAVSRHLLLGRAMQSGTKLQLAFYQENMYYLSLLDMKSGNQAPSSLSEYSNTIPFPSTILTGIVLECGAQADLACVITSNPAVSRNFLMVASGIQPISSPSLEWMMISTERMIQYQNPFPNITAVRLNRSSLTVYHATKTSVSYKFAYYIADMNYSTSYFSVTNNGDTLLIADTVFSGPISQPDTDIRFYKFSRNDIMNPLARADLKTFQNETLSRLITYPDESFTLVGTTWGNLSAPSSLTGLVDSSGFAYQALFLVRFQSIRVLSQSFEFIDVENNTSQVTLVLDGVTQTDSPSIIAFMSQRAGVPLWLNATSLKIHFERVGCGRQTLTVNFTGIPSNPSLKTSVDVPLILTFVTPLNGTVGTTIDISGSNLDGNWPSVTIGNFLAIGSEPVGSNTVRFYIPEGGGTNLPIIASVNDIKSINSFYFNYDPPIVDSVSPNNAATFGPILFNISGSKFGRCETVYSHPCGLLYTFPYIVITIGNKICNEIRHYYTSLLCVVQQGIAGIDLDVVVGFHGQNSSTSSFAKYSSLPPSIVRTTQSRVLFSASDPSGPYFGIEGQNFGPPDTAVSLVFTTSSGLNYTACNSSVSLYHTLMNW